MTPYLVLYWNKQIESRNLVKKKLVCIYWHLFWSIFLIKLRLFLYLTSNFCLLSYFFLIFNAFYFLLYILFLKHRLHNLPSHKGIFISYLSSLLLSFYVFFIFSYFLMLWITSLLFPLFSISFALFVLIFFIFSSFFLFFLHYFSSSCIFLPILY